MYPLHPDNKLQAIYIVAKGAQNEAAMGHYKGRQVGK